MVIFHAGTHFLSTSGTICIFLFCLERQYRYKQVTASLCSSILSSLFLPSSLTLSLISSVSSLAFHSRSPPTFFVHPSTHTSIHPSFFQLSLSFSSTSFLLFLCFFFSLTFYPTLSLFLPSTFYLPSHFHLPLFLSFPM